MDEISKVNAIWSSPPKSPPLPPPAGAPPNRLVPAPPAGGAEAPNISYLQTGKEVEALSLGQGWRQSSENRRRIESKLSNPHKRVLGF